MRRYFFIGELFLRVFSYLVVHKELDSFLVDPLNICDILVVSIDLVLLSSEGEEEENAEVGADDTSGFVKALRSARGVRLLRLLRAARALRLLKGKTKLTQQEAIADPRSVKITFTDLSQRMLTFVERQYEDPAKSTVVQTTLSLLVQHLKKGLHKRENPMLDLTDYERIRLTSNEIKRSREIEHARMQHMVSNEAGAPRVILKILSHNDGAVFDQAVNLGEQLLCARNYDGQGIFFNTIEKSSRDGSYFVAMRDCIRASREMLFTYRMMSPEARNKMETKKGVEVLEKIKKIVPLLRFLSLLCEGHYEKTQDIMRSQPRNVVTVNLLNEVVDFFYLLGKSLPHLRVFKEFE